MSNRANITNEYQEVVGGFNTETSYLIQESRTFNGSNWISDATGSQWGHERLYLTKGGKWIMSKWSDWQGSTETFRKITPDEAYTWMMVNASEGEVSQLPAATQTEYVAFVSGKEF